MEELITIDIEGNECRFEYMIEYGDELSPYEVTFKVFSIPEDPMRWFSYRLKIINERTAKSEMMTTNSCSELLKKGFLKGLLKKQLNNLNATLYQVQLLQQAGDYLVGPSYSAWQRLTEQNDLANLDEENHRFILTYQAVANNN